MLIDTHCHLLDERFNSDRNAVLARARQKGVTYLIEIACHHSYWQRALELARANDKVCCALGLHPQDAKDLTQTSFAELKKLCLSKEVVGIGETGLDYFHENSPRDSQKKVFIDHINLSLELAKPLIVHCRDAYPDLKTILKSHTAKAYKGVVHCFSGSISDAEVLLAMGFYLGIDGPVTYPKAAMLKEVVKLAPIERLIIETDSPYLPPQEFRGKRNEPAYIELVAKEIANIKNISFESAASITSTNALNLFGLEHATSC